MYNEETLNKIKHVVISNLAVNEFLQGEVYAYNDVVEGETYMAFTQNRIFYWHSNGESSKLKTKSYNLITSAFVSRGVFSIHFNDEIVKFLVFEGSEEFGVLRDIIGAHTQIVDLSKNTQKNGVKGAKNDKPELLSREKKKKTSVNLSSLIRAGIIFLIVIVVSFVGTMGFIYGQRLIKEWNSNDGLTQEKIDEIKQNISIAENRSFMLKEAETLIKKYEERLFLISPDIEDISPSDKLYDWASTTNTISNHKITLVNFAPVAWSDVGPYFDIKAGGLVSKTSGAYNGLNQLLNDTLVGLENRFSSVSELGRIKQEALSIKQELIETRELLRLELEKVSLYISEQKTLIQQ